MYIKHKRPRLTTFQKTLKLIQNTTHCSFNSFLGDWKYDQTYHIISFDIVYTNLMEVIFKCFLVKVLELHSMTSFDAQFEKVYLTALRLTKHLVWVEKTAAIFSYVYQGKEIQGNGRNVNFHSCFSADVL